MPTTRTTWVRYTLSRASGGTTAQGPPARTRRAATPRAVPRATVSEARCARMRCRLRGLISSRHLLRSGREPLDHPAAVASAAEGESDGACGPGIPARTRSARRRGDSRPSAAGAARSRPRSAPQAASSALRARAAGDPSLCGDAHAPIWLPRGRVAKYASDSRRVTSLDRPLDADLARALPSRTQRARAGSRRARAPLRLP